MPRTLFRIVKAGTASVDDFRSRMEGCFPPRPAELGNLVLWVGISVYDNRDQAAATSKRYPRLGGYVAEMHVPDNSWVVVERTLSEGHHTVVGCASILRSYVVGTTQS